MPASAREALAARGGPSCVQALPMYARQVRVRPSFGKGTCYGRQQKDGERSAQALARATETAGCWLEHRLSESSSCLCPFRTHPDHYLLQPAVVPIRPRPQAHPIHRQYWEVQARPIRQEEEHPSCHGALVRARQRSAAPRLHRILLHHCPSHRRHHQHDHPQNVLMLASVRARL